MPVLTTTTQFRSTSMAWIEIEWIVQPEVRIAALKTSSVALAVVNIVAVIVALDWNVCIGLRVWLSQLASLSL